MPEQNDRQYSSLRSNVSLLGSLLGETMAASNGEEFLEKVEKIRLLSKSARGGDDNSLQALESLLADLGPDELAPVARAFAQFLNLANIAEQHHGLSREMDEFNSASRTLHTTLKDLQDAGLSGAEVYDAVTGLGIELVLTAHPTEITRRSLIHKYEEINRCLGLLEFSGLTDYERNRVNTRLRELVAQLWHTHEFREARPTPVDEARWGFAVVENSLWRAVPDFLRRLDDATLKATGRRLPLDLAPVRFSSWMGGDRDGNPFVTASVTQEVLLRAQRQSATLYLEAVDQLIQELSMSGASEELRERTNGSREPYRALLRPLRAQIEAWQQELSQRLAGALGDDEKLVQTVDVLAEPLELCYRSLSSSGLAQVADGRLLDLLRQLRCFGLHLGKLDIRQHSDRHTAALSEITQYLGIGDYADWGEEERRAWILKELSSRRPLIPESWNQSEEVAEVLASCRGVARQPKGALACYIISMARQVSDILAVELLLKASGGDGSLPVVPLFETLDDLDRAPQVLGDLIKLLKAHDRLPDEFMVMIGYSDSAKDAGILAAGWAQYSAQESLVAVCKNAGVRLQLFHGRGGTIGRGGAPAHDALLSQAPGSLECGLRVTEQGEMIRTKLGLPGLAVKTLAVYTSAILEARSLQPPTPAPEWRDTMERLAAESCKHYRALVRDDPRFVDYFRQATPEGELAELPLASRPTRRKRGGGIESLRAIPWIFAWTQNRLMLPSWLGAGQALAAELEENGDAVLSDMAKHWPLFSTRLSMLEMVYSKADLRLAERYDRALVEPELQYLGERLRAQLADDVDVVLRLLNKESLLENEDWPRESLGLRNVYTDPLNILQVELLGRLRSQPDELNRQAIMITIAGVAAGMRNTG